MTIPRSAPRPTMKDVAARAGVSLKTVSRVVNREDGVSAGRVERVQRAAEELGYQPDAAAGNLRRSDRRSHAVGLLLSSAENPFDAWIQRGVEDVAAQRRTVVLAASSDESSQRELRIAQAFTARRVDGLILLPAGQDQSHLAREVERGTPVVAVDRPARGLRIDAVLADNRGGARAGVEHLMGHGHRRIAVLGHLASLHTAAERLAGAREALAAAGAALPDELVVQGLEDEQDAARAVHRLLDLEHPPTALFATRNVVSAGAFRALRERGELGRTALAGFDDFAAADLLDPPLTVITQEAYDLGRAAAERVFARMEDPRLAPETITIPTRLIVRGSCGC